MKSTNTVRRWNQMKRIHREKIKKMTKFIQSNRVVDFLVDYSRKCYFFLHLSTDDIGWNRRNIDLLDLNEYCNEKSEWNLSSHFLSIESTHWHRCCAYSLHYVMHSNSHCLWLMDWTLMSILLFKSSSALIRWYSTYQLAFVIRFDRIEFSQD